MCFYYDEEAQFSRSNVVKARKPHRCSACRREIAAGEQYERHSGLFDGSFFVEKVCRRCCYDTFRVVEHELAEGCFWSEAWPAVSDLVDYLMESDMSQTDPEKVPAAFKIGDQPPIPKRPAEIAR